jgi:hypothetical protein
MGTAPHRAAAREAPEFLRALILWITLTREGEPTMYTVIYGVIVIVILLIVAGIRSAIRRSNSASELSQFQHHLAAIRTPFDLASDERVLSSVLAHDLGAIRGFPDGSSTVDEYPACFPLVYLTNLRFVVLMSTTDKPTAITGTYPANLVNLRQRIGEQFSTERGGFVSSASCRWESVNSIIVSAGSVGFGWTDREGVGAVIVELMENAENFVQTAAQCITDARTALAIIPAEATVDLDSTGLTYSFDNAAVICGSCGARIEPTERFCTGCGGAVSRMENA